MDGLRNMLVRFAIFNGIVMPRLLSEEEYNKEIEECDFALDELERDILDRPGRGHQRPGIVKRPTILGIFNNNYINAMLHSTPATQDFFFWTPQEIDFMLPLFEHRWPLMLNKKLKKGGVRGMFFIVLRFVKSNDSMRSLEKWFQYSKSEICDNLPLAAMVLQTVLDDLMLNTFPTRAERDEMRHMLPPILQGTGIFGSVDSTKICNLDSIEKDTRKRNFETHKGFGINCTTICDLYGRIRYYQFDHGHEHGLTSYRSGDFFLRRKPEYIIGDDEALDGDAAYTGLIQYNLSSMEFPQAIPENIITQFNDARSRVALRAYNTARLVIKNPVEQANRSFKRNALVGDRSKCRISLNTNESKAINWIKLAVSIEMLTMNMRGQYNQSNMNNLCLASIDGPSPAALSLARTTFTNQLLTARNKCFYGEGQNYNHQPF